jgi:hypothetical protein
VQRLNRSLHGVAFFAAMAGKMLTLRDSPEVSDSTMRFSMR